MVKGIDQKFVHYGIRRDDLPKKKSSTFFHFLRLLHGETAVKKSTL